MSTNARVFSYPALALVFLSPAMGGLLFGYDVGATSFAISMITDATPVSDPGGDPWWAKPTSHPAFEEGLIVSAVCLGALIGSTVAFRVADAWGRLTELRVAAVLYLFGALLDALSGTALAIGIARSLGVACLVAGRMTYGAGVGFAMHSAPTYMAEMTPPSIRGAVVTAKEAVIVLGMILGYGVGFLTSGKSDRWFVAYAFSILIALPMLALTYAIPPSARWLLLQDRVDEALQSLRFVYRDEAALMIEYETMKSQLQEQNQAPLQKGKNGKYGFESRGVFSRSVRRALIAGVGLVVFQQITGQPSVMTYVTLIFSEAGLGGQSSILVAVFMFFSVLATVATVDRYGRKTLLFVGCSMMLVAVAMLTFAFRGQDLTFSDEGDKGPLNTRQMIILFSMFLYIGGYEVGFGPITWLVLSEIFPLDVRGQAVAIGVQVNFALNFLVQLIVPSIQKAFGLSNTFALFTLLTVASLVFIQVCVVETKGLSLEEIESKLRTGEKRHLEEAEATENDLLLTNLN